jgi:ribosomal protein S18 acetylase RimI-like enzyme
LRHVEDRARALGCRTLMLTVNKLNTDSVAVYRKAGFTVREEAVFDIGNGYVMDDYVMEKRLTVT